LGRGEGAEGAGKGGVWEWECDEEGGSAMRRMDGVGDVRMKTKNSTATPKAFNKSKSCVWDDGRRVMATESGLVKD